MNLRPRAEVTGEAQMKAEARVVVQLDLTTDEIAVLRQVLDNYLSDLRMEIADTDRMEFRDMLKHRKTVITKVIEGLPEA